MRRARAPLRDIARKKPASSNSVPRLAGPGNIVPSMAAPPSESERPDPLRDQGPDPEGLLAIRPRGEAEREPLPVRREGRAPGGHLEVPDGIDFLALLGIPEADAPVEARRREALPVRRKGHAGHPVPVSLDRALRLGLRSLLADRPEFDGPVGTGGGEHAGGLPEDHGPDRILVAGEGLPLRQLRDVPELHGLVE